MIGDFLHLLADGGSFPESSPRGWQENLRNANSGLIDQQRNATGIVPGSRHLVLDGAVMNGDWR
ncbi:hypothetical protein ACLK1S_10400 [Escherichia coli]